MKKIFLLFIIMLSVSPIFSENRYSKELIYNQQLRAFGLYDIDGIDFDVKAELVNRLCKRSAEEKEFYKELIANPPEGYEFTEYDIKKINKIREHQKMVQEHQEWKEKIIWEFQEKSKQNN